MQKIGSLRSINPYNPFLGMWVAITRKAKGYEGRLHPEEALTREQAIRFYTMNNASLLFLEDQVGSLEPGKLADFVVLDRDILTCPEDEIREIQVAGHLPQRQARLRADRGGRDVGGIDERGLPPSAQGSSRIRSSRKSTGEPSDSRQR